MVCVRNVRMKSLSKTLIIARGLPGGGKSTACADYINTHGKSGMLWHVVSADRYFISSNPKHVPVYRWSKDYISCAHLWCKLNAEKAIYVSEVDCLLVDNTNVKRKHYQPYIDLANQYGYTVKLLEPSTPWAWDVDECFRRNVHGVPLETIKRMKEQYEQDDRFETVRLAYEG